MPTLSDLAPSIIRTLTPMVVGVAGGYEATYLGWTTDQQTAYTSAAIGAAYYLVVHLLEHRWPSLGALLGYPVAPHYDRAAVSATVQAAIDAAVRAAVAEYLSAQSSPQTVSRAPAPASPPAPAPQPASAPAAAPPTVALTWAELTQGLPPSGF